MKLRRMEESDIGLLAEWTKSDPCHSGYAPNWICSGEHAERFMLEDSSGPRLAFRISKALRVDIQFGEEDRIRTARALVEGFAWLLERARKAGFSEVIFESKAKPLVSFCKKRFDFRESPSELVRQL